jgi:hypothetical protein
MNEGSHCRLHASGIRKSTVPIFARFKPIELAHNVQRVALGELLVPCIVFIKSFHISNLHSFSELASWVQFRECLRA